MPPSSNSKQFWTIAAVIVVALIATRLPQFNESLMGRHSYRQTQTAITAYWFVKEGIQLPDYPRPTNGAPWTCPLEFPTFQLIVSLFHRAGLPIDLASRVCGFLSFLASIFLAVVLLRKLRISNICIYVFLLFAAFTPFSLVWSTASLIEFTCVALGLSYLYFCFRLRDGMQASAPHFVLAIALGCLAAVSKITTFPIFWGPCFLLASMSLWEVWTESRKRDFRKLAMHLVGWGMVLSLPLVAGVLWNQVTDVVKQGSFITANSTSESLVLTVFGTLSQRFSLEGWAKIIGRSAIWGLCGLFPFTLWGLYKLLQAPKDTQIVLGGLLAGACGVVLIFFNLYAVHDYYQCATMIVVWAITALGIGSFLERIKSDTRRYAILGFGGAYLLAFSVFCSYSFYEPEVDKEEILSVASKIQDLTHPQEEFILFRIDWNPSLTYHAERKSLIADERLGPGVWLPDPAYLKKYAEDRQIRYAVTMVEKQAIVSTIWPHAKIVSENAKYLIYDISPTE